MMPILLPLVLALTQSATARERTLAESTASGGECQTLSVTSTTYATARRVFSAAQTPDLKISVTFPNTLTGSHRLQLLVRTPQGQLYQRFIIPFDATLPRHERGAVRSVSATLPVAGTAITTSGLYGRWTVVPSLDGGLTPCTWERHFVIEP